VSSTTAQGSANQASCSRSCSAGSPPIISIMNFRAYPTGCSSVPAALPCLKARINGRRLDVAPLPSGAPRTERMQDYRAYFVGPEKHFIGYRGFVCQDDGEAIEKAKEVFRRSHD
jgi:hypothetical protein